MNKALPYQQICTKLTQQGWCVLDDFTEPGLIQQLAQACLHQHSLGLLKEAGIGRGDNLTLKKSVRSDQTRWLEPGMADSTDAWLSKMDDLRQHLNKQLFLGLKNDESHFAVYAPGAFYQKHLDRFQNDQHQDDGGRVISSVLYLNASWKPGQGGELRLHLNEGHHDIEPIANRLVLFVSAEIWHEVLPTHANRMSLTGWFRN